MKNILPFLFFVISIPLAGQSLDELFREANNDVEQQNPEAAFAKLEKIDSIRPHHPAVINQLLKIAADRRDIATTLKYLRRTILMQGNPSLLMEPAYDFLKETAEFVALQNFAGEMARPELQADTAFLLADRALHPESITYDPGTSTYFISSIHKRKIVSINLQGHVSDFSSSPILRAMSGLAVDSKEKVLWATSCAIPEMENFSASEEGSCMLIKLDIQNGQVMDSFSTGGTEKHHWGDVIVDLSGNVYISDSAQPVIYTLKKGSEKIVVFRSSESWMNLQGLSFSADQRYLYVADYIKGLYRIEMANTDNMVMLATPDNFLPKGIDGLYCYQNSLIAIQNGVQPFRVARLHLNSYGDAVTAVDYLEKGTPRLGEPTLGTIVEDSFYFIANSPWGYYSEGQLNTQSVPKPLVLKLKLK